MRAEEWFTGADGRDDLERIFLTSLRALAAEALSSHIDAAATSSSTALTPLHVGVDVPSLPGSGAGWPGSLQAAYFPTGTPAGPRVQGEWSLGGYVMDGNGDPLDLDEVLAAPSEDEPVVAARRVSDWLAAELIRPIERLDWNPNRADQRTLWRFADSSSELHRAGRWLLHRPRNPDAVAAVR